MQVAVAGVCGGAFLLAALADPAFPAGLLKSKLAGLAAYLEEALSQLATPD